MPVPVPPVSKPVAHPVFKSNSGEWVAKFNDPASGRWQRPMAAVHPMPTWGMATERMYEDPQHHHPEHLRNQSGFFKGLAVADNAPAIKGAPAEACIPPMYVPLANGQPLPAPGMVSSITTTPPNYLPLGGLKPAYGLSSSQNVHYGYMPTHDQEAGHVELHPIDQRARAAFLAAMNEQCMDVLCEDVGTPFTDFVDRAITSSTGSNGQTIPPEPVFPTIADQPQEPAATSETASAGTPVDYRKLAEPLAEWVASYVWKVCTEGLSLPASYTESVQPHPIYPATPPSYLSSSIHSLLLSTLLQPSAVFLSIWYIVRLPVYFAAVPLSSDRVKEATFRSALLGKAGVDLDKDTMEASTPFRLVVLGAMLANKWLDDHTFSNKTWHTISRIPIEALNKLEALTLDIFGYDLSVPTDDWSEWLEHVYSYHLSLSSPSHPQPISRPSANPHGLIRRVIEELLQSPVTRDSASIPQPVFVGLEQRRQEKLNRERSLEAEVMEIDLDEDGPLREEYMLKRRVSNSASYHKIVGSSSASNDGSSWDRYHQGSMKSLPPPAKWSPGADEPILSSRNRVSGHYAPVQPIVGGVPSYSTTFYQPVDSRYSHWQNGMYAHNKGQTGYYSQAEGVNTSSYSFQYTQVNSLHSRSQSASYDQENVQARHHLRSQSQARCGYQCSDIRMTANNNQHLPSTQQNSSSWGLRGSWGFGSSAFAPIHNIPYPSTWLRI